jgi:2-hydroxychromene-2-carboxylate isomerase
VDRAVVSSVAKSVEFYFDYGSPNAYLGWKRLAPIAQRTGASIVYRIISLGAVLKATNNVSPAAIPAKRGNSGNDLRRFASRYGVPFQLNPFFPINTLNLMRGAIVAEEDGILAAYSDAVFRAMWVEAKNLGDQPVLQATLAAAGIDPHELERRIAAEPVKDKLKAYNAAAVARGVFGAPTFFVDGEMFFGQDRLDFVEEALNGRSYL